MEQPGTQTSAGKTVTAAVIIIGDEILGGTFRDENSPWLIGRCRELGLDLLRVLVIPDDIDVIAHEVATCARLVDWVFTTGGVGPTHDDVTMLGIAGAFGLKLRRHPDLVAALTVKLGDRLNDDALVMADVPQGARLWLDGDVFFPQVVVQNIAIFPGVPHLLRVKFDAVAHRFGGRTRHRQVLVSSQHESAIAGQLRAAQQRWPDVHIGSYPRPGTTAWTVMLIMDSHDAAALAACTAHLREQLATSLLPYEAETDK